MVRVFLRNLRNYEEILIIRYQLRLPDNLAAADLVNGAIVNSRRVS